MTFGFAIYTSFFLGNKKQRYKWPLMELKVGSRFISDAFLPVQFLDLTSSNAVHLAVGKTTFTKCASDCG